jgi:excisionase family DNA binding protein
MQIASPPLKPSPGADGALRFEPLWTVPELAAYLRLSKSQAYELVNRGCFGTPIRLGPRGLRIRPAAVEVYLTHLEDQYEGQ